MPKTPLDGFVYGKALPRLLSGAPVCATCTLFLPTKLHFTKLQSTPQAAARPYRPPQDDSADFRYERWTSKLTCLTAVRPAGV